jgi:monofunctional biosynthetic peptidoglycan transglycosylase
LTQQTVKNAYLWHGRSWLRKGIEAVLAIGVDFLWSKSRILEVYLNIAEFGPGLFGAEAAAQHYFNRPAADLTLQQAAALASVLPAPQVRSPVDLSPRQRTRAARIADGAQTILNDGRAACFAD